MLSRMGWAKSVTQRGRGVAVLVGRGAGVTDEVAVPFPVGVNFGAGTAATGVRLGIDVGVRAAVAAANEIASALVVGPKTANPMGGRPLLSAIMPLVKMTTKPMARTARRCHDSFRRGAAGAAAV